MIRPASIRALAERALRGYLETPPAYIALFVFYAISSYLFALPLFLEGQATLRGLVDFEMLLLTLFVPALTMGLLAEELRSGTFETLATLPLEEWDIALGKYAACAALLAAAIGGLSFFGAAVAALAQTPAALDWGEAAGTLGALLLLAWTLGAAGLFASSWSDSQIVAYLGAFAIGFVLLMLGKIAPFLPERVAPLAELIGLDLHVRALAKGVVDLRDVAYFASLTFGFLYLTAERLRRRGVFSVAGAALTLGALVALNLAASRLDARLDLSANRSFSISTATRDALEGLSDTLLARVYFTPRLPPPYSLHERYLRDLLAEYRRAGRGKVTVEYAAPTDAARQQEALSAGVVPVEVQVTARDKFEIKQAFMGLVLLYKGKSAPLPIVASAGDLEYELTRRVRALSLTRRKRVGFLTGHGERAPGAAQDEELDRFFALLGEQLEVSAVSLATAPATAFLDALWALAPSAPLKKPELERLSAFAASGKPVGLLLSRRAVSFSTFRASPVEQNLAEWLREWGLEERPGFVVDAHAERIQLETQVGSFLATRYQDYPFIPLVSRFDPSNPAVKRLRGASFPFAHPLRALPGFESRYASLAETGRDSWYTETPDVSPLRRLDQFAGGEAGPFSVAGVASKPGSGRLIVVGTGYLVDPRSAGRAGGFSLLANLIDWSVQDESLLSIRGKGLAYRPLRALGDGQRAAVKAVLILALPSLVLAAAGLAFQAQRRRRAATAARYADA